VAPQAAGVQDFRLDFPDFLGALGKRRRIPASGLEAAGGRATRSRSRTL